MLCFLYPLFNLALYIIGEKYLVSASRDRLIHVFDVTQGYSHLTTLSDHSSSILSVKLVNMLDSLLMISISSDKVRITQFFFLLDFSQTFSLWCALLTGAGRVWLKSELSSKLN